LCLLFATGRRRELVVASVSYLVGALLTSAAPNFLVMVVGRFLYGIGIGLVMKPFDALLYVIVGVASYLIMNSVS
jgi:predicted MFS family arabinose efflux permease